MPTALPPSPSVHPVLQGLRFARDPFGFLEEARRECGDTFSLHFPGDLPRVVTCDPEHIRTILALPTDVEGDATSHYLAQRLKPRGVRVTRLAHGLPAGTGLEYADELTLGRALSGRRAMV